MHIRVNLSVASYSNCLAIGFSQSLIEKSTCIGPVWLQEGNWMCLFHNRLQDLRARGSRSHVVYWRAMNIDLTLAKVSRYFSLLQNRQCKKIAIFSKFNFNTFFSDWGEIALQYKVTDAARLSFLTIFWFYKIIRARGDVIKRQECLDLSCPLLASD